MLIRDVLPTDLDRLLEINEANVPDVGPADRDHLAFLLGEAVIALVVDMQPDADPADPAGGGAGDLAGFCLVLAAGSTYDSVNYRYFMDRDDRVLYLDRVAFDRRFRRRGLGTALYAAVLERMQVDHPTAPALTLEVNVDPPNEPSLRFHAGLGFVEVGRQMSKGIEVALLQLHRPGSE